MQDLISDFYLINYNATYDNNEVHSWPYSPWPTRIWYILSIKVMLGDALLFIPFDSDCVHIYANQLI
jgi:hypothetical protein